MDICPRCGYQMAYDDIDNPLTKGNGNFVCERCQYPYELVTPYTGRHIAIDILAGVGLLLWLFVVFIIAGVL